MGIKNTVNAGESLLIEMKAEFLKAFLSLQDLPVPREKVRIAIKARSSISCSQVRRTVVVCVCYEWLQDVLVVIWSLA